MLKGKHFTCTPEATLDLVDDQQRIFLVTNPPCRRDVVRICRVDSALPLDDFQNDSGSFICYGFFQRFDIVEGYMAETRDQRLFLVERGRERPKRPTVKGAHGCDYFCSPGGDARELECCFHGFCPRVTKKDPLQPRD